MISLICIVNGDTQRYISRSLFKHLPCMLTHSGA